LMAEVVLAIIGDSVIPSLSLLFSRISDKFVFFYTSENKRKAEFLQSFCENNYSGTTVAFLELPSIAMPEEIVKYAKEFMSGKNEKVGIFLTSGAKQTILPFLINSVSLITITLQHSPLTIIVEENRQLTKSVLIELSIDDILASRGWEAEADENGQTLKRDDVVISNVQPLFNEKDGLLSFTCESYLLKNKREDEIHSLEGAMKQEIKEADQIVISNLILLSEFFGRNGAKYIIRGALRSPNRSVLPSFIQHKETKHKVLGEE